jgi:hypothetical protein
MTWKIYYGDGSTFRYAATDMHPEVDYAELAPTRNVQAIVQEDPDVGWVILSTHDYYWWEKGRWFGGDYTGMLLYLMGDERDGRGWKKVLFGRTLPHDEYKAVYERAKADWGEKQGFKRGERKP